MGFTRLTSMAQAFANAALKDNASLDGKSTRWVARNVADKLLHADRWYSVHVPDKRPVQEPKKVVHQPAEDSNADSSNPA